MAEFRYRAITADGRRVQGYINAKNLNNAKKALDVLSSRKNLKIEGVDKQSTYVYKAKGKYGEKVQGRQKAYTKAELQEALSSLDYTEVKVDKMLIGSIGGVPASEIAQFLSLCSDLLKENLPFEEILSLIASDTKNITMKSTIREVLKELKEGKDGKEVFNKHVKVFGKFPAYMMGIATTSGNMQEIFESTAKFIKRKQEFKKKMKNALFMPAFTMGVVIIGLLYYILKIIPGTLIVFEQMNKEVPPFTSASIAIKDFLVNNPILLLSLIFLPIIAGFIWGRTEKGKLFFAKITFKLPIFGKLLHNNAMEVFARVFQSLYSGSGANISVIRIAAESTGNYYFERQIKDVAIPLMLKEGKGLVASFVKAGVFTTTALSRFKSGEESGSLRLNAKQLADYYESENSYALDRLVSSIEVATALIITMAMLFLTLVSSETVVF